MGGRGWWLGLAIDLDAGAVVLSACHVFLRLLLPCLFIRLHASLGSALESFQLEPASYVGHRVSFLGGVQRI